MAQKEFCNHSMKVFVAGCVFIFYFLRFMVAPDGCSLPTHSKDETHSPILLYDDSSLMLPNTSTVPLWDCETVVLLCPDPKNYLVQTHLNITYAQCIQGRTLSVYDQKIEFDDLQCHHVTRGIVSATKRRCGNGQGLIFQIGYELTSTIFIKVIETCYNPETVSVLYTEHSLYGKSIKYASKSNYRPMFSSEGATPLLDDAYKQVSVKEVLSKLLKSGEIIDNYANKNNFLARGHLSPDADFFFAATQYATYFYINACPQWQMINAGNWLRLETMVRKLADQLQETLTIVTGTYEVEKLKDDKQNDVAIYLLPGNKLPVPKFVWKAIYSTKSKEAIVLVNINNPFITNVDKKDILCTNICNKSGWESSAWNDYKHGFMYCCDYREFSEVVETAPKLQVVDILRGPH